MFSSNGEWIILTLEEAQAIMHAIDTMGWNKQNIEKYQKLGILTQLNDFRSAIWAFKSEDF